VRSALSCDVWPPTRNHLRIGSMIPASSALELYANFLSIPAQRTDKRNKVISL